MRGNAAQIYEKYQQLARDASSSGDRISAENLLQHAEHYFRLMDVNGGGRTGLSHDASRTGDGAAGPPRVNGGESAGHDDEAADARMANFGEQPTEQPQPSAGNGPGENGDADKPPRRARSRRPNGAAAKPATPEEGSSDSPSSEDEPNPATA